MTFNFANRKTHAWISICFAAPLVVVIISGILLQLKKQLPFVQPVEQSGIVHEPLVTPAGYLEAINAGKQDGVVTWKDVQRVDIRPSKGIAKVILKSDVEYQIDLGSGHILQREIRRSDFIESLHDGSFFAGDISKLGVFLPAAIGLLILWLTGIYMFWLPLVTKWKKQKRSKYSR
ncbi:MAG: hypothetical protein RLZZ78_909 [Armatimonadota bacterium]